MVKSNPVFQERGLMCSGVAGSWLGCSGVSGSCSGCVPVYMFNSVSRIGELGYESTFQDFHLVSWSSIFMLSTQLKVLADRY